MSHGLVNAIRAAHPAPALKEALISAHVCGIPTIKDMAKAAALGTAPIHRRMANGVANARRRQTSPAVADADETFALAVLTPRLVIPYNTKSSGESLVRRYQRAQRLALRTLALAAVATLDDAILRSWRSASLSRFLWQKNTRSFVFTGCLIERWGRVDMLRQTWPVMTSC